MAGIAGGLYKQVFSVASTMQNLANIHEVPSFEGMLSSCLRYLAELSRSRCKKIRRRLEKRFGLMGAGTSGFDQALTRFWDWNNKGRQWKDIRYKYVENEE